MTAQQAQNAIIIATPISRKPFTVHFRSHGGLHRDRPGLGVRSKIRARIENPAKNYTSRRHRTPRMSLPIKNSDRDSRTHTPSGDRILKADKERSADFKSFPTVEGLSFSLFGGSKLVASITPVRFVLCVFYTGSPGDIRGLDRTFRGWRESSQV